jgi:hypothetical protein
VSRLLQGEEQKARHLCLRLITDVRRLIQANGDLMSKTRSNVTVSRSVFVFLAVGPLAGWVAMFTLAFLLIGDITDDGPLALLALLSIGIPYAYGFGSAPALLGGVAYWALRRRFDFRPALTMVTVAGTLFGPVGAVIFWLSTPAESGDIFARWPEYLVSGGCAAFVCALLSESRLFRIAGVARVKTNGGDVKASGANR